MPNNTVAIKLQVRLTGLVGVTKLNAALEQLMKSSGGLGRSARNNKAVWEAQNRALENAAKATQNIAKAQTNTTRATTGSANAVKKLTAAERLAYSQEVSLLKIQQKRADAMKTLGGRLRMYEQDVDSLFRAGYRLQMLGSDLQMIGKRMFDFVGGISEAFGEFEFMALRAGGAMNVVSESVEPGVADMQDLESAILNSARSLRLFDPTEVAEATYYWASTTGQAVKTQEQLEVAMRGVNPIMKAAAMTNTDYETAIKGVYSIIVQYGKSLDDVADVTQKLFKATNVTAAEFPDLINSFKMVGPIAKENGVTFEQMVEQFGRLADVGIRGTMVGRAFRQLFIQLAKPSAKAKEALDDLWESTQQFGGKSFDEMIFPGGNFVGIDKYVDLMAEAMKDLTVAERNHIIAQTTTANELPVVTALIARQVDKLKGLGDGWDASKYAVKDAADYFNQSWDKLSGSWKGLTSAIENGVEIIRIQLGGRLAAVARPVLEEFRKMLDRISDWMNDPANAGLIDFFLKLSVAVGALALGAGVLASFAGGLIAASAAASLLYRSFSPLFGVLAAWGGVIVGIATAVVRNLDYIVEAVGKVGDNLTEAFGSSGEAADGLGRAFAGLMHIMEPFFNFLVRSVADLAVGLSELLKWISKSEIAMQALSIVAQVLAAIFAARMIAAVLGLSRLFTVLAVKIGITRVAATQAKVSFALFAVQMSIAQGVMAKTRVAASSLGGAISKGLRGALGGGWIGAAIAAFLLLYETFPPLHDAVDDLADSFKNLRQEALDAIGSGSGADQMKSFLDAQVSAVATSNEELQAMMEHRGGILGSAFKLVNGRILQEGSKEYIDEMMRANAGQMMKSMQQTAEKLGIAWEDYVQGIFDVGQVAPGTGLDQMEKATQAYFAVVEGRSKFAGKSVESFRQELKYMGVDSLWIAKNSTGVWNRFSKSIQNDFEEAGDAAKGLSNTLDSIPYNSADQTAAAAFSQAQSLIGQGGTNMNIGQSMLQDIVANRSKYGPRLNQAIDDFIGDLQASYATELVEFGDEMAAAGEDAMEVSSQGLIDGAKSLKDLPSKLKTIMKEALQPDRQMSGIFADFYSGTISKGFRAADGHIHVEAQLAAQEGMDDAIAQWEMYANSGMPEPDLRQYAIKIGNQFKKKVPEALPKEVPTELRQQLTDYVTSIWEVIGKPVPQYILDRIWKTSEDAGEHTGDGYIEGVTGKTPEAETAAGNVKSDAIRKLKPNETPKTHGKNTTGKYVSGLTDGAKKVPGVITRINSNVDNLKKWVSSAYSWGDGMVSNFARGMLAAFKTQIVPGVDNITAYIHRNLHHTTPDEGPLAGDDMWGYDFVSGLADSMNRGLPELKRSVNNVADAVALTSGEINAAQNGVTLESSSRRSIDVNIKVTSPDGSVDRVQTAQLQSALMSSDLVLSLEHMATVG